MPNWCSNNITFYADTAAGVQELFKMNKKLLDIDKNSNNLYSVLENHDLDPSHFSCRGTINYIDEITHGCNSFYIQTETAWSPTAEMWEEIQNLYPGVSSVFIAEEPGCDYYVNSDEDGLFYAEKYKVDQYYSGYLDSKVLSKLGYGEKFYNKSFEVNEYFSSKDEVLGFYSNLVGRLFSNMKHLEDFYSVLSVISDDSYYFGLHKYEPYSY